MILEVPIVSPLAGMLDFTMLLPLITPQNTYQSDGNPHDLVDEREGLRVPLRVCHSIPDSSFPQKPWTPDLQNTPISRSDSKKVRFATYDESIQYFDPTERALCVQKSMSTRYSRYSILTVKWTK
jgi:hypothetical protein